MSQLIVIANEGPIKAGLRHAIDYAAFWPSPGLKDPLESLIGMHPPSVVVLDLVNPPDPALVVLDALATQREWSARLHRHAYLSVKPDVGFPRATEDWLNTSLRFGAVTAASASFGDILDTIRELELAIITGERRPYDPRRDESRWR